MAEQKRSLAEFMAEHPDIYKGLSANSSEADIQARENKMMTMWECIHITGISLMLAAGSYMGGVIIAELPEKTGNNIVGIASIMLLGSSIAGIYGLQKEGDVIITQLERATSTKRDASGR